MVYRGEEALLKVCINKEGLGSYVHGRTTVSTGNVTVAFNSSPLLENWPGLALVKVLGPDDHVVWLLLAVPLALSRLRDLKDGLNGFGLEPLNQALFPGPVFFELVDLPLWELVDSVGGKALSLNGLLGSGEVGGLLGDLTLLDLRLDLVGLRLSTTGSRDVKLELREQRLLDVGDRDWFVAGNPEGLNDTRLQVNQEWLLQVLLEVLWEVARLATLRAAITNDTARLSKLNLAVQGDELRVSHLDAERVVRVRLDDDLGGELDSGTLRFTDLWDTSENLGLEAENAFLAWGPAIAVQRVGVHGGND